MLGDVPLSGAPFASLGDLRVFDRLIAEAGTATDAIAANVDFLTATSTVAAATDAALVAPSIFNAPIFDGSTGSALPSSLGVFFSATAEPALTFAFGFTSVDYASLILDTASGEALVSSFADFGVDVNEIVDATDLYVGGLVYFASVMAAATGVAKPTALQDFLASVAESSSGTDQTSATQDHVARVLANATGEDFSSVLADFGAEVVATAAGEALVLSYAVFIALASEGAIGVDAVTRRLLWEVIDDAQLASWQNIENADTATWGNINASQSGNWQNVNSAETAGWGAINDTQTTPWTPVKTQS